MYLEYRHLSEANTSNMTLTMEIRLSEMREKTKNKTHTKQNNKHNQKISKQKSNQKIFVDGIMVCKILLFIYANTWSVYYWISNST